ncbi:MAG: hypothetical protein ACKO0M_12200 [Cyanobium sp.]
MPDSSPADPPAAVSGEAVATGGGTADVGPLIAQLNGDRLWLLRQIDSGRWAEWRLDLAALERELGQLLELAREHGGA